MRYHSTETTRLHYYSMNRSLVQYHSLGWIKSILHWYQCMNLYLSCLKRGGAYMLLLLLPNNDRLQQVEGYVRSCTTSTKYWPLSTSWRLCQKLYHFYQILTAFNKLKIMSEVIPLLPNTDRIQQVEDYVRGWTWQNIFDNNSILFIL